MSKLKFLWIFIIIYNANKEIKRIENGNESNNKKTENINNSGDSIKNKNQNKQSSIKIDNNIRLHKTKLKEKKKRKSLNHFNEAYTNLIVSFHKYKKYLKNKKNVSLVDNQKFLDKFDKINSFLKIQDKKLKELKNEEKKKKLLKAKRLMAKAKTIEDLNEREILIRKAKRLMGEHVDEYISIKDVNEQNDKKNLNNTNYLYGLLKKTTNTDVKEYISNLIHYHLKNKSLAKYITKSLIRKNYLLKLKYNKLFKKVKNLKNEKLKTRKMKEIVKILNLPILQTIKDTIKRKKMDRQLSKKLGKRFLEYAKKVKDNKIKKEIINKVRMMEEHPSLARKINDELILNNFLKKVPIKCKSYVSKVDKLNNFVSLAQKPYTTGKDSKNNIKMQIKRIVNDKELDKMMAKTFSSWLEGEIKEFKTKNDLKTDKSSNKNAKSEDIEFSSTSIHQN